MSRLFAATLAVAACFLCGAQVDFEAASIRPSGPKSVRGWEGGPGHRDPTHFRFGQATLKDLIVEAWDVDYFQVSGASGIDHGAFDLAVVMQDGTTKEQFHQMMQRLLAERFGLKAHVEKRDFPAYELVAGKSGFKDPHATGIDAIPPRSDAAPEVPWPALPGTQPTLRIQNIVKNGYIIHRFEVRDEPIAEIAKAIGFPDDMPVVDRTGLTDKYSFAIEYATLLPGASDSGSLPPAPDLVTVWRDKLGLEVRHAKVPFDVVVVDSFRPEPTEN